MVHTPEDGRDSLLWLRYPSDLIGDWWPTQSGSGSAFSAVALGPCSVHELSLDAMRTIEARDRSAADFHRRVLQLDICGLAQAHLELKTLPPQAIVERRLWSLASVLGRTDSSKRIHFVMPLTNAEMASLCGLSETHYKIYVDASRLAGT